MERKYPKNRPIAIDFFCGAGGLSLGLEQAGFDIALGIDIDGHHVATHERNFPYGKTLCASITDLNGNRIRDIIETNRDIDVVVGGPPCQGFSFMGLRDLNDPRNSLIDHFVRLVLELRPKTFVMENVPGLASGKTRDILDKVLHTFQANEYNVTTPVQILDASNFGVPQQRRRLFLLGIRREFKAGIQYPTEMCIGQPPRPTIFEAIGDLPEIERYDFLYKENDVLYDRPPVSTYAKVARGLAKDPSDISHPRIWDPSVCSGCLRTQHNAKSVEIYAATEPGSTVPGHKLPRLSPNGICPTLRAGSDSTHGSYTSPRPIHPIYPRCITSREAARLHGFPDWFAFYPLKWHAYRQIGNAVCPPVARAIGYAIRKAIGGKIISKAPSALSLSNAFLLPEDRPRTLKRIPHLLQFPPVIKYLFDEAYDSRHKKIRKATFSFNDVLKAIKSTNVNLHWVRADTFLSEISRNRRVNEILAPIIDKGYSIVEHFENGAIGKFVPTDTPGTLEKRNSLHLRMDDIHDAESLQMKSFFLTGGKRDKNTVLAVLSESIVQRKLWHSNGFKVTIEDDLIAKTRAAAFTVKMRKSNRGRYQTVSVLTCKAKLLPNKTKLCKIARECDCEDVAIIASATRKHFIALRFENCLTDPREIARATFELF